MNCRHSTQNNFLSKIVEKNRFFFQFLQFSNLQTSTGDVGHSRVDVDGLAEHYPTRGRGAVRHETRRVRSQRVARPAVDYLFFFLFVWDQNFE